MSFKNVIGTGVDGPHGLPAPPGYSAQYTVSGTLSPDVTGTYTWGGDEINDHPIFHDAVSGYDLWVNAAQNRWILSGTAGSFAGPRWRWDTTGTPSDGPDGETWEVLGEATGTPVVAPVSK